MESKRLLMRRASKSDLVAFSEICQSEFVLKYNCMKKMNEAETLNQLEEYSKSPDVVFLELKDEKRLIGAIFIDRDSLRSRIKSKTLSYYLSEKDSGKGYMSEALSAIMENLFTNQGLDVVSARVFSLNSASINLLIKLGFSKEGCLRKGVLGYNDIIYDDVLFSILKEEYFKRNF